MITNRDSIAINCYLKEVAKTPMVSPDEEVKLAARIKTGDRAALHRLIQANLRFVVTTAKKYQHRGLPLDELIAEGNIGLIRAAERFDAAKGVKFITFAVYHIMNSIMAAIEQHARLVRLPVNKIDDITQLNKAIAALEQETGREPTSAQLAEYLGMDIEKVIDALKIAPFTFSYDLTHTEEQTPLIDRLPSMAMAADQAISDKEQAAALDAMLAQLTALERQVICFAYGIGTGWEMPVVCAAAAFGVKPTQVYYAELSAMRKLKNNIAKQMTKTAII